MRARCPDEETRCVRVLLVLFAAVAAGFGSACRQPQAQWVIERTAGRLVVRTALLAPA
jgi:hypothetical protein